MTRAFLIVQKIHIDGIIGLIKKSDKFQSTLRRDKINNHYYEMTNFWKVAKRMFVTMTAMYEQSKFEAL